MVKQAETMTHAKQAIDYAASPMAELVTLTRSGHHEAFRHIMQRCNQRLFRVARAVLNDDSEAEDALQDAYIRAFDRLDSFRGDSKLGTWLTRIVLNECYQRLRKQRPTVAIDKLDFGPDSAQVLTFPGNYGMENPINTAGRSQVRQLIESAIEALAEPFRVVFVMRSVEEYSTQETAEMLGIPPDTVKTRLHRARRQLRHALSETLESSLNEAYPFLGRRCARISESVMQKIGTMTDNPPPTGEH